MPSPKKRASTKKTAPKKKVAPAKKAPSYTAEIAEKLLNGNLANIARKVQAGKTLTAAEKNTLKEATTSPEEASGTDPLYAKSYIQLGEIIGVDRVTFVNWRKKFDDAPRATPDGRHDVAAWRLFIDRHGLKGSSRIADPDEDDGSGIPTESLLKRRKLLLWCQEQEIKLEKMRGELIEVAIVREEWGKRIAGLISFLRKRLENEMPNELEGLDAADIHDELVSVIDELCEIARTSGIEDRVAVVEPSAEEEGEE